MIRLGASLFGGHSLAIGLITFNDHMLCGHFRSRQKQEYIDLRELLGQKCNTFAAAKHVVKCGHWTSLINERREARVWSRSTLQGPGDMSVVC